MLTACKDQDFAILSSLGKDTNAIVWPHATLDEDEEVDPVESPDNLRLMRIGSKNISHCHQTDANYSFAGDNASDLDLSDAGSVTSDEDSGSSSEDEEITDFGALASSLGNPAHNTPTGGLAASADARLESEFKHEVELSLERAFAEGHSVDNAAVELKTLRMASNVPLIRVREAVVGAIVERIVIVDGGAAAQRKEITSIVGRWGGLIDQIGGVDAVETVSVLQVCGIAYFLHV